SQRRYDRELQPRAAQWAAGEDERRGIRRGVGRSDRRHPPRQHGKGGGLSPAGKDETVLVARRTALRISSRAGGDERNRRAAHRGGFAERQGYRFAPAGAAHFGGDHHSTGLNAADTFRAAAVFDDRPRRRSKRADRDSLAKGHRHAL